MTFPISAIQPSSIAPVDSLNSSKSSGGFQDALANALSSIQQSGAKANATVDQFLTGESSELHQVAIDTQRAELQFEMFLAVRNKFVQAYQEVMKMQM